MMDEALDLYNRVQSSSFEQAKLTLSFLDDVIAKYGVQHLALAFNGGKDCTVLLELIRASLAHNNQSIDQLRVLYFDEIDAFDEMTQFLNQTKERYHLTVETLHGSFHAALHSLFNQSTDPSKQIKGIFMGQRRCDPSAQSLDLISPSSNSYPKFDRINPLLDWHFNDIWRFLREFALPYCSLYDQGYTSIGNKSNCKPNSQLWLVDEQKYAPAWMLDVNIECERGGRVEHKVDIPITQITKSENADVEVISRSINTQQSVSSSNHTSSTASIT